MRQGVAARDGDAGQGLDRGPRSGRAARATGATPSCSPCPGPGASRCCATRQHGQHVRVLRLDAVVPQGRPHTAADGFGVVVLDMTNPKKPRKIATLTTPAMLSPHESLIVNQERGLLGAVMGNAFANLGILDLYDVRDRLPQATPAVARPAARCWATSAAGRPDGNTFYATSTGGQTLAAIDVRDPAQPQAVFSSSTSTTTGCGSRPTAGRCTSPTSATPERRNPARRGPADPRRRRDPGPERRPAGQVVANLDWSRGIDPAGGRAVHPQGPALPARGRRVLPVRRSATRAAARRGCGPDHRHRGPASRPKVVSDLRLEVHQPGGRAATYNDPGAPEPARRLHRPLLLAAVRRRTPGSSPAR